MIENVEKWLGKDNKIGIDIWKNKYQHDNESFSEWLDRVSNHNDTVKELIYNKQFIFGGRILANRGLQNLGKKITYSNCYVISQPEDNIESIFETAQKLARTFSYGGGCGVDISNLRPKNARVNNSAKETTGAVSFMDLYDLTTSLIGQQGRRGALMLSLDINHPDILDFINIKTDVNKITKANISLRIDSAFMRAVENNTNHVCTFDVKDTDETIVSVFNAKEIWDKIMLVNWDYADVGMLFWDEISQYHLLEYHQEFEYAGTNPCVTGDTTILTDKGHIRIDSLIGKKVNVWNGYEYSEVEPKITGRNQRILNVEFSNGRVLKCTPYHKFILSDNSRVEAKDLKINDKLIKFELPLIEGLKNLKNAYSQGAFSGDGFINLDRKAKYISLYGEKKCISTKLAIISQRECSDLRDTYNIDVDFSKDFVPSNEFTIKDRLEWLAGLIDTDGSCDSTGNISISSINKDFLLEIQLMLQTISCNSTVTIMKNKGTKTLPDGKGGVKEYNCQDSYRLLIPSYHVKKLLEIGLTCYRVNIKAVPNRDAGRFIYIKSITEQETTEDIVYCFNEPKNHSGIFNGIITSQCAEEPLPAGGSCLLGSLILPSFVENGYFNFNEFAKAVRKSVIALNDVLDEGLPLHPLQEQRDSVRDWRQIGLGILGLGDTFIKLQIKYDSEEAIALTDRIGFILARESIYQSSLLAKEFGTFPKYESCILESEFFLNHADDNLVSLVKKYGLRNSQILTTAPTGSLGTMLEVSTGIEPNFLFAYTRKTESLHKEDVYYTIFTKIAKEYMEKHNIDKIEDLPPYFVCSQDIDPIMRVRVQGALQRHIDGAISSTINLPNSATVEDVSNIYMEAWKNRLKGITIFRDGCKRSQILFSSDKKEATIDEILNTPLKMSDIPADTFYVKRKITHGCGTTHLFVGYSPSLNRVVDVYNVAKMNGGCQKNITAQLILISQILRVGGDLRDIQTAIEGIDTCASFHSATIRGIKTSAGRNCPSAMLREVIKTENELKGVEENKVYEDSTNLITCPSCGEKALAMTGGCHTCLNCSYTKCD
ncbi:MAG: LAGLIDADG family homing endonuclease [Peptostreptococcaceae bacterium]